MKAVQITLSEELLHRLDQDDEVQREGRSAFLRKVAIQYLERKRLRTIRQAYQAAYADPSALEAELDGWEEEGEWPQE